MELAINNGLLIDPGNQVFSKLNIAISKGRVQEITNSTLKADTVIDACGMAVAPGFIDAHMHEGDYNGEKDCFETGIFECMLRMGVTSAIGGNCGGGPEDPVLYMDAADRLGLPINLALLAPHESLRINAGVVDKYSTAGQNAVNHMKELAEQWLACGCIGISYGIRYIPGIDSRELHTVSEAVVKGRKIIAAHIRDDASMVIPSTAELIEIAERYALPVQISHIGSMSGYGQMEEVLAYIDCSRSKGLDVAADCYPYTAFSTCIGETTYDEGFLERYNTSYESIEIAEGAFRGSRCTEALFRRLRKETPDIITIGHVMKESEVDMALIHPNVLIGSDGFMHAGQGHPRVAGTFPRILSEYVRERKLLSLNEAIGKMTWQTASRFGIPGGELGVGSIADIVVFNPDKIQDRASFKEPILAPEGIEYVLLGGKLAVRHGKIIDKNLGRSIRK